MDDYGKYIFIGEGSMGQIYRAVNKVTKEVVAVKVMKITEKNLADITNEILTMKEIQHLTMINLIAAYLRTDQLYIVMECLLFFFSFFKYCSGILLLFF